jgi:hypothetical protein
LRSLLTDFLHATGYPSLENPYNKSVFPMKTYFGFSCALLALIVAFPAMAARRAPADVAVQWGLIGTWASDCRQPPARQNAYYSYLLRGKSLLLRRDLGSFKDENKVISAEITHDNGIELVTDFTLSHVMTARLIKDAADQFHVSSNQDENGVYTIENGKLTGTGSSAPVMTRCLRSGKG